MQFANNKTDKKINGTKSGALKSGVSNHAHLKSTESEDLDMFWLIPIVIFLIVIAITDAKANISDQKTSIKVEESVVPNNITKSAIEFSLSLEQASNLQKKSDPDRTDATSIIMQPSIKLSEKSAIKMRTDLVLSSTSEHSADFTDTVILYQPSKYEILEGTFYPNVALVLPTSDNTRKETTLQGGISFRPTLEYPVSKIKGLTLGTVIYMNKSFHEYEVKRNFEANVEYSVRGRFIIFYQFSEKFAMELLSDYVKGWSYNGYSRDQFYFRQELSHKLDDKWSIYLSHKNEGTVRGPNNHGENVDVYSARTSYLGLGVTHVF